MELYDEIFKLKNLIRKGWRVRELEGRLESDAEHTFSMLILGLELMSKNDLKLDKLKVVKMIAYHELCEIDAGDHTPFDKITKQEKFEKEYACVCRLAKEYNMPEIESIWLEFEKGESEESKFVKRLDKYDAIKQAKVYAEKQDKPELYEEFKTHSQEIYDYMKKLDNN